jgi:hypothetical protein
MPIGDFPLTPFVEARLGGANEAKSDVRCYLEENAGRQSCCKAVKNAPRNGGGQRRRE